jgi:hypothetical protein
MFGADEMEPLDLKSLSQQDGQQWAFHPAPP